MKKINSNLAWLVDHLWEPPRHITDSVSILIFPILLSLFFKILIHGWRWFHRTYVYWL